MSGLENFILILKDAGFPLVLLWLLTLSVVYGLLSHAGIPKSITTRGAIAIVAAFMVLFAAAATPAIAFIQSLMTASILLAVGILIVVIFLELGGVKKDDKHLLSAYPQLFGGIILGIFILIFIGAGGIKALGIPSIKISETMIAIGMFVAIMIAAIWLMYKESKKAKK